MCFAPCFLGAFLGISGALNGLTVEENVAKLKRVSFHHKPGLKITIVTTQMTSIILVAQRNKHFWPKLKPKNIGCAGML